MKTLYFLLTALLIVFFAGCEEDESKKNENADSSSLSFTDCKPDTKSAEIHTPSVRLTGQAGGSLQVQMINTEFCCGTDSVSIEKSMETNKITIEIIDNGPFTYCFCPHDLEFSLNSFDNAAYELTLIESEHAYSRDTFLIQFTYSEQLDTTIEGPIMMYLIGDDPMDYLGTELGGCNGVFKSADIVYEEENDTIRFNEVEDTLKIFVGLNLTCCMEFGSASEITGDTLIMRINTLNNEFCDCICYYTFTYFYENFTGQGFYYQFYIDDYKRFEGSYNLP